MRLVITEKPSVARDLAQVLGARRKGEGFLEGDGLRITWCVGHLVELEEPHHYDPAWRQWSLDTLPMLPPRFALRVRRESKDQFEVVKRLIRDRATKELINACDAGREGELIFRYVYELAGAVQPASRLWLASLTEQAIREAWGRLRPSSDFDPLGDAARCRSEADWLVGMNATRAMTCLARRAGGGAILSIGRVQTPTLAMIVGRDAEIAAFVPEPFWQVRADFQATAPAGPARWTGVWFRPSDAASEPEERPSGADPAAEAPQAERLDSAELARALADAVRGRPGRLERSETRRVVDKPPLLYDLTTLQRRANQRYGLSAQRTLEVAQALYERHKLITYPRTDARHLTPDQVAGLPAVARGIGQMPTYAEPVREVLARWERGLRPGRRVVDATEVGDHHAILPTGRPALGLALSPDEKRVFDLVARRFLAALSDDALFDRTTLIVAVQADPVDGLEAPPRFRARGRVCVQEGWRAVDPPGKSKELDLPRLDAGRAVATGEAEVLEGATRPPRPFDDGTLLKAMETAGRALDDAALERALRGSGLGTPATRASILQTLLDRGFVERRGRELRATDRGAALIGAIPAPELKSAELTGRWEERLARMERGKHDREVFMRDVVAHVRELTAAIRAAEPPTSPAFAAPDQGGDRVGACPRCKGDVVERRPVYACVACPFVLFKTMSGRAISRRVASELLSAGRSRSIKGFKSKRTGKEFEAGLMIRDDGTVGLWFPDEPRTDGGAGTPGAADARPPGPAAAPPDAVGARGAADAPRAREPSLPARPEPDRVGAPRAGPPPTGAPAPTIEGGPEGLACPRCGEGRVLRGRRAWGCGRYAQGCAWTLAFDAVASPSEATARVRAEAGG
jgi:DNA topoisomerase III